MQVSMQLSGTEMKGTTCERPSDGREQVKMEWVIKGWQAGGTHATGVHRERGQAVHVQQRGSMNGKLVGRAGYHVATDSTTRYVGEESEGVVSIWRSKAEDAPAGMIIFPMVALALLHPLSASHPVVLTTSVQMFSKPKSRAAPWKSSTV